MKQKTKKAPKAKPKSKKRSSSISKSRVVLMHARRPVLKRFRLVEHKYTGRLVHHRYTSHIILVLMLLALGFFLYISSGFVQAESGSGLISIGVIVSTSAPKTGAVITSPKENARFTDQSIIGISGTCEKNTFVIIKDNGQIVGSTMCNESGGFSLQVQLQSGTNILSALNYDNLNQAGPNTPSVTVYIDKSIPVASRLVKPPILPDNPSIVPGVSTGTSSCDDYAAPTGLQTGGELRVAVVCVPRILSPNTKQTLGILAWGGLPPYVISIHWDASSSNTLNDTLFSLSAPSYKTTPFVGMAMPNTYRIAVLLKDQAGNKAVVNTAVQVSGTPQTTASTGIDTDSVKVFSLLKSSVPFYSIAVALTLGFWGGDFFVHTFGSKKGYSRKRRTS